MVIIVIVITNPDCDCDSSYAQSLYRLVLDLTLIRYAKSGEEKERNGRDTEIDRGSEDATVID